MRPELERIALCDRYLNDEMNSTEKIEFEKKLITDDSLRSTLDIIRDLRSAVLRKQIREKIEANRPGKGFNPFLATTVFILIAGIASWFFLYKPTTVEVQSDNPVEKAENPTSDSIGEQIDAAELAPYMLGKKKLWVKPDIQTFEFDSKSGATIEGKEGMVLFIPSNAFIDSTGRAISGKVNFQLVEALGISDMILYQLHTVSNNELLESGGMFYTGAEIDNTPVRINPKRPIYIEIPTTEVKPDMLIFSSEVKPNGAINWIDPKPLQKYLVTVPLSDLDFLPEGFESAVKAYIPFLNYKNANKELTDSLYYALQWNKNSPREVSQKINVGHEVFTDTVFAPDTAYTPYDRIGTNIGYGNQWDCGVDPSSVETLKNMRFQHSFIATEAFAKRMRMLHKAENGEAMLNIYIRNLSRDLYISDSLVAQQIQSDIKPEFQAFAKEHLTNIEDGRLYADQLEAYYTKERARNRNYHQRLAGNLAKRDVRDLQALMDSLIEMKRPQPLLWNQSRSSSAIVNGNSRRVYAAPWSAGGWGNIDKYMKQLNSNSREVAIVVSEAFPGLEVTQWLGEINSYTDLLLRDGKYYARFPASVFGDTSDNHVFACAKTESGYKWGFKKYTPMIRTDVHLKLKDASEAEIKSDLKGVEMKFGHLKDKMDREALWQAEQIKRVLTIERQNRAWVEKRSEISQKYNAELQRQAEVDALLFKLRNVAFPCPQKPRKGLDSLVIPTSQVKVMNTSSGFTIVEQMPSFPGGDEAMQKYIQKRLKYPEPAKMNNISGVVFVTFVVNADGKIKDPKVLRGLSPDCDAAALDLVRGMPDWKPGKQRGVAVPVQYNLPVNFPM